MSDGEDSPLSQFSVEDDEVVWAHASSAGDDDDYIVLRHPLPDARSLPSTLSGHHDSDGDLFSTLDHLSMSDHDPLVDSSSASAESDVPSDDQKHSDDLERGRLSGKTKRRAHSSDTISASSKIYSGASTPTVSYDAASAFISRFISSPGEGSDAKLDLLRSLIIELGLRSSASDLPCTLTAARKVLKSEAHINIKEYIATRHRGQSALRGILKPSKSALRKEIRKGNAASLQWVKQHGLQVLLVTCFT